MHQSCNDAAKCLAYSEVSHGTPVTYSPGAVSRLAVVTGISAAAVFALENLAKKISAAQLDLRGKTVLITGGSRGLGFALAQQLASRAHASLYARVMKASCTRLVPAFRVEAFEASAFCC